MKKTPSEGKNSGKKILHTQHSLIQKEEERTTDKELIVARAAKAIIMRYLYDAHSDWLKQRAKSE